MNDDSRYDQIHRYLLGEMEGAELAEFQQRLQDDPQLAADVALEEELQLLIQYERKRELKEMLRNAPTSLEDAPPEAHSPGGTGGLIRPPWKRVAAYTSGIAAILVAGVLIFNIAFNGKVDRGTLFKENMEEVFAFRDQNRGTKDTVPLPAGYKEYEAGHKDPKQYATAYSLLDTMELDTALLMHGIAAMAMPTPNFKQAARDFERLESLGIEENLAQDAHWYHALVDLQEGQDEACRRHLDRLIDQQQRHKQHAAELKAAMEKLPSK